MIHQRRIDSDEYYPVYFFTNSNSGTYHQQAEFTCEEIDFIQRANLQWDYAQMILAQRAGAEKTTNYEGKTREQLAEELRALGVDIPPTPDEERGGNDTTVVETLRARQTARRAADPNGVTRSMSGTEWPAAVGKLWDENRSRFSTSWDDLPHHDQVAVYRLLTRPASSTQPNQETP